MPRTTSIRAAALAIGLLAAAPGLVGAQTPNATPSTSEPQAQSGPQQLINDATNVVVRMQQDANLKNLMARAKGIYIVPHLVKGAAIVGGEGGTGVMLARNPGGWSDPVFYRIGGASIGLQAGFIGGPVALLLMSDTAVNRFRTGSSFAFDAGAGLAVMRYSMEGRGQIGRGGDVIVWTDPEGLYAGVDVGASDIAWAAEDNSAYYRTQNATAPDILNGRFHNPQANALRSVLAS